MPVDNGLSQIGAAVTPENREVGSKRDGQLRAAVTIVTAESEALSGKGKSAKLVGFVDHALMTDNPSDTMKASFSKYLSVGSDSKIATRVGKLSQEVYTYAIQNPGSEKTAVLEDALRSTLASLPLLDNLDTALKSIGSTRERQYFFDDKIYPFAKLDGLVNPYLFDKDRSNGLVCRDMTSLVDATNKTLSGAGDVPASRSELTFLREQVQSNSWGEIMKDGHLEPPSFYEKYQRFEEVDLKIVSGGPQNAYEILGLSPNVNDTDLAAALSERKREGYIVTGEEGLGANSCIRNAAFQLQTPEGKRDYDLYLRSKTEPHLEMQLRSTVVSRAEAQKFGTVPNTLRMLVLHACITEAIAACPR